MSNSNSDTTTIIDGRHYNFRCSGCNAPLADIWVNHIDDSIEWNFIAECCHCGDKSYQQTILGMFSIGQTEEGQKYTAIEEFTLDTDPIVIKTKQVKPYVS
jgi:hypothetical protein